MGKLHTILLVEDDKMTRQMLREVIEDHDFLTLESVSGDRAVSILGQHEVHAILLDLRLPDGDGMNFIPKIREKTKVPIIVVSGTDNAQTKVACFKNGADDFVTKPFDPRVLVARISAHIRKVEELTDPSTSTEQKMDKIKFAGWTVDRLKLQLFDSEQNSAELTAREFKLLDYLIVNNFRAVSRDDLCEALRQDSYVPTPRSMDIKVTRIRKKIGDCAEKQELIRTVRGVGYIINKEKLTGSAS